MRIAGLLLATAALVLLPRLALAEQCAPGSHTVGGKCDPWDCAKATDCDPNMVCKPIGLCIRSTTNDPTDAAVSGEATQNCADGTCPSGTRCSTTTRCLTFAAAERLRIVPPQVASVVNPTINYAPTPSASASPAPEAKKKSSCGCDAVGAPTSNTLVLGEVVLGALLVARRRRRRNG